MKMFMNAINQEPDLSHSQMTFAEMMGYICGFSPENFKRVDRVKGGDGWIITYDDSELMEEDEEIPNVVDISKFNPEEDYELANRQSSMQYNRENDYSEEDVPRNRIRPSKFSEHDGYKRKFNRPQIDEDDNLPW